MGVSETLLNCVTSSGLLSVIGIIHWLYYPNMEIHINKINGRSWETEQLCFTCISMQSTQSSQSHPCVFCQRNFLQTSTILTLLSFDRFLVCNTKDFLGRRSPWMEASLVKLTGCYISLTSVEGGNSSLLFMRHIQRQIFITPLYCNSACPHI